MILAGDIGGTKCNFALLEEHGGALDVLFRHRYPSQTYSNFSSLLSDFLRDAAATLQQSSAGRVLAAGFGVAGPVVSGAAHLTNLGWNLERAEIQQQLGTPHVALLNDLEAAGYSLARLKPQEVCVLNSGTPAPQANRALIAAGTGLGEAMLRWSDGRYIVEASEGGHCDLAPRTGPEIDLLRAMKQASPGPVSWEMILSGRGFLTIHRFLDPSVQHPGFEQPDTAAPEITRRGLDGSCSVCVKVLDMWTALYGAEAGNLALKALARGGMFIAGGIAPKILPKMKDGTFLRAFCEKSKFSEMLAQIPMTLVLNEEAPLLGAASEAARLLAAAS